MKRKFIYFTDKELIILTDALQEYRAPSLLKQINEEIRQREYNNKLLKDITENKPKIYCC